MTTTHTIVVLFFTSNHAFRAEKVLIDRGIACKLVPVPRHLSSECGVCLRLDAGLQEEVLAILKSVRVDIDKVCQT